MTLMDLFRLIRKYWYVVLICTLVGGGAAGLYVMMSKSTAYSATANVVGNSQVGAVLGFANAESRKLIDVAGEDGPYVDYKVEAKQETGTQVAAITVTGPKEDMCIQLANQVADAALTSALASYGNWENPYTGYIDKAEISEAKTTGGGMKYVLVGLLGGLFLGICIVVIIDMVRRPVKSIEGMQDLTELPVLEKLPAKDGNRLLANIRFAAKKDDLQTVCVVPLGEGTLVQDVCAMLKAAMDAEKGAGDSGDTFEAVACEPLSANMDAAYRSRKADAVIVAGRQWDDSLAALESTVAELKLAETNLVGLVFAEKNK